MLMRQTQSHPQGFLLIQSFCQANIARSLTSTCRAVALLEGRTCAGAQRSSFTPAEGFTHGHRTGHFPRSPCFLTEIYLTRLIQVLDMKEVFPVSHVPHSIWLESPGREVESQSMGNFTCLSLVHPQT